MRRLLLIASHNPGSPLKQGAGNLPPEAELWSLRLALADGVSAAPVRAIRESDAEAISDYCAASFAEPRGDRDHVFHRRVQGLARACIWLLNGEHDPGANWLDQVWLTDVLKCQTAKEVGPKVRPEMYSECFQAHLSKEISHTDPKVVLALGKPSWRVMNDRKVPNLVRVTHPSNSFAQLHMPQHDSMFDAVAHVGGSASATVAPRVRSREFLAIRRALQAELFPSSRLRERTA